MTGVTRRAAARLATSACVAAIVAVAAAQPWQLLAQAPEPAKVKYAQINEGEMKEWLYYLASDELQGRQIYTEGYGLATEYVADHLKAWGVKPLGDDKTFFQLVRVRGYKSTRNSSITLTINGQSKTFKHGDHVTFGANAGAKQTIAISGVEFVGYGSTNEYKGRDVKGKLVVSLPRPAPVPQGRGGAAPATPPAPLPAAERGGSGTSAALNTLGARASLGFAAAPPAPSAAEESLSKAQAALEQAQQAVTQARQEVGRGRGGARGAAPGPGRGGTAADFTTVQRIDNPVAPQFTGDEALYEFLFSAAPAKFAELKAKADKGEALTAMTLANVTGTVTIDNTYELVSQQLSKNVVGMVEGSDPKLKDTYIMFGAHLDHVGYRSTGGGRGGGNGSCRRTMESVAAQAAGRGGNAAGRGAAPVATPLPTLDQQDVISNGADDDGSGSTALMAIAKAFATGPKPRRSLVFVWHAGEEAGLLGSRYNADFPVVPLEKVQAQLNMDMIGRDDCDNANGDYTNSVFVVGADRISTDLHNLIVQTNGTKARPLTLDYELNDPNDPENIYTRSDHYSYASKGIPIAFFTTGLHHDYHQVSDSPDKILYPKLTRITQLVYEVGYSIANTDRVLQRDNKGPRSGKGFSGTLTTAP